MKTKKRSMSDAAVAAKTGKTWPQWFAALDKAGARKMEHRAIATLLYEKHKVPGWWAQMVTVEYERARGMRDVHQTTQGYVANVSRTFDAPVAQLFRAWTDAAARRRWLGNARLTITSATPGKYVHIKCGDGTRVDVGFNSRGKTRCQMAVQHSKLGKARDVAAMKKYWGAALDRLKESLAN
jgi:hypothetical protein